MIYVAEDITAKLKEARESKGLSQRELSKKVGVPQSHISKIENGAVDVRLSSLIELARILDLELALVPRKAVSAVQSIVRSSAPSTLVGLDVGRRTAKELKRFQDDLKRSSATIVAPKEAAQLQRQLLELQHFPLTRAQLRSLKEAREIFNDFLNQPDDKWAIHQAVSDLRNLRNTLAHSWTTLHEVEPPRPAYSLDEEDESA